MTAAKSFEDLEIWKAACRLVVSVYGITDKAPLAKDLSLKDQIRRSAISVPSNIAEGFERGSNKDFARFLWISKGSIGELRTQLYLAVKTKRMTNKAAKPLISECKKIAKQTGRLIRYLYDNPKLGTRNPKLET